MNKVAAKNDNKIDNKTEIKLYKIRWLMLFLFVCNCIVSLMQWIQYSIISDVVVKYYNVSYEAANWTSMIYLLLYIPFIFPGSYILERFGLRVAITLGSLGTCLGAWIKVFSVAPDKFWVLMVGQSFVGIFEVFLLGTSAHVAAEWFGCNEVSSACSIGAAGCQLGVAVGFVLTPMLVRSNNSLDVIEVDLLYMAIGVAVICSITFMLTLSIFRDQPPLPPSQARLLKNNLHTSTSCLKTLKKLITNRNYVIVAIVYGFDVSITYTLSTLLNQIILSRYEDAFEDVGRIGLLLVLAGTIGAIPFGIILDKFKLYKTTFVIVQLCCLGTMCLFTFCLTNKIVTVYLSTALMGFFTTSVIPIGFEVAAEITYPEPEGTSSGLLNVSAQSFGILLTYLYSYLFYNMGVICANAVLVIVLLIGFILLITTPFELKRQEANCNVINDNNIYVGTFM